MQITTKTLSFSEMASREILNLTTNRPIKLSRAKRLVDECVMEWIKDNRIVRELSRPERIEAIRMKAESNQPVGFRYQNAYLPPLEPNACKFEPPANSNISQYQVRGLIMAARRFYENAAAPESSVSA